MASDANIDRFLLASGGAIGFGSTFLSALSGGGDDISGALLRGSIGMIAGVVLVKILIAIAHSVFRDAKREKMIASIKDHKEENAADSQPSEAAREPSAARKP